jgi:DNA-binding winged helix-turn-helix (wHTH) protein
MNPEVISKHSPAKKEDFPLEAVFPSPYLHFGEFHLDLKRQTLFKNGTRVKLQEKLYQVLITLLENPGDTVTREAMRPRLWPNGTFVNFEASVNTAVNKLRQVLGDSAEKPVYVETIPRKGYRFIATVESVAPPAMRDIVRAAEPATAWMAEQTGKPKNSFPILSKDHSKLWFTVGIIALFIASILFGAAVTLFSHWHI